MNKEEKATGKEVVTTIVGSMVVFLLCALLSIATAQAQEIVPEQLINAEVRYTSAKDSAHVCNVLQHYVQESRISTDINYYQNVWVETDRTWDYAEYLSNVLIIRDCSGKLTVSVNWDAVKKNEDLIKY